MRLCGLCEIGKAEVDFNGHRISAAGIRPLLSDVNALLSIPIPSNQRQLTRFICTASYYLKFVPGFAALTEPLRKMLKPEAEWNWLPSCQSSFDVIKAKIASPPKLAHFDPEAETIVACDASATALGAALSQRIDGQERPVAFISRLLTPTERNYSASEREALACLWGCERWHYYLYARRFQLQTDHMALKSLLSAGGKGHRPLRIHRWADRLFQYDFQVVYRPGKDNIVADCLSRAYEDAATSSQVQPSDLSVEDSSEDNLIQTIFGSVSNSVVTLQNIAEATAADQTLSKVLQFVVKGWPTDKRQVPDEVQYYCTLQQELSVCYDGKCLVRGTRTVIPAALHGAILDLLHEGHPGVVRMKCKAREAVWYRGIDADIEHYVGACEPCIISGKSISQTPGPLQPLPLPAGPWRRISVDVAGEFKAAPHHQRFLIVVTDHYSRWPEVAACENVTSATIITFLTQLFDRLGLADELISDNGSPLVSAQFEEFLSSLDIHHQRSALYSPQTNSSVERFNRVLKEGVRVGLAEGKTFLTAVRQTVATYRVTPNTTTGVTPAALMFAFPVKTPVTMLKPVTHAASPTSTSTTAASPGSTVQSQTADRVAQRVQFKQQAMKSYHDKRTRAKPSSIKPGDFVRIKRPVLEHKLSPAYSEPVEVRRVSGNTVWLVNGKCWNVRRCLLHVPATKPVSQHHQQQQQPASDTASEVPDDDDDVEAPDAFPVVVTRRQPAPPVVQARAGQQQQQQHQQTRLVRPQQQQLRRTSRVSKQVDFGPVIRHSMK